MITPPRTALLVTVSLLIAFPVRAEEPAVDCENATSTIELNVCSQRELDQADAALNAVYKKVLDFIAKSEGEKPYDSKSWEVALRESQRAWVAFRDADCNGLIPMSWSGGTGTALAVLGCLSAKTKARTKELEELYELE